MSDQFGPERGPDFGGVEELLRSVRPEDLGRREPPADLWDAIESETQPKSPVRTVTADAAVVDLGQRRGISRGAQILVAAAATIAVIAGVVIVSRPADQLDPPIATAELVYDAEQFDQLGENATATVSLFDDNGTLRVHVEESDLPDPAAESADLEVWLIEPDSEGNPADLVSLGLIDPADPADLEVPADYDPAVYSVVDISVEPRDGNTTHSGRSILRGPLET
jgi:anti-sigma-K factor RskA